MPDLVSENAKNLSVLDFDSDKFNAAYAEDAMKLLRVSGEIQNITNSFNARNFACYLLISCSEFINLDRSQNPVELFKKAIWASLTVLKQASEMGDLPFLQSTTAVKAKSNDASSNRYHTLLTTESDDNYFTEPLTLLRQRFERNGFPIARFQTWNALEAGCGNGRNALALRRLGMERVVGIDINPGCVAEAQSRAYGFGGWGIGLKI